MKTRLVRVKDISPDDEGAWRRLAERAVEPNPFAEPDFFTLSARYFEGYGDATVVIAEEGSEFLGVLAVAAIETPRLPPRRVASTRANPLQISGLHTPLVDRADPHQVVDALVDGLSRAAKSEGWPGILLLDEIGSDGPVAASLLQVCAERRYPVYVKDSWERATVTRAGQWENPVDGKRRREIRRRQRLLTEEAGGEVVVVDRSLAPGGCDDFMAMEIAGWKGREGGHAFARYPNMAEWFRQWHGRLVAEGRATLLSLEAGSRSVAMAYVVRAGDGLFCFRIAFDEAYAKFGPGPMLLSSALTQFRDTTDAAWFDSMTSKDNTFFLGLLPERRRLSRLFIGTGGALDRALVSALPALAKLGAARRQVRHRLAPTPRGGERSVE